MKPNKKLSLAGLAAVLVVSCTCSLLPFGINLPQSMQVGSYITVNYPEEWFGTTEYDIGVFSPDYMDLEADDEDINQPFFFVIPLDIYFGDEWFGDIGDPEDLLDEMAFEFDVGFSSTTTVEVGNVRWTKGTFRGPFGDFLGIWEGWIAIQLLPRGGAVVMAVAPESDWSDVDNIFDAMMDGMEFAD